MNTLSAIDLKRRGIEATEEKLAIVPVHILKHNRPAAVIIRESEYQNLLQKKITQQNQSAVSWILEYKSAATRSKNRPANKCKKTDAICWNHSNVPKN